MSVTASRRVVITGMGLISPLGLTPTQLWDALSEGRSGVARLENLPTDNLPIDSGGEARGFTGEIGDFGNLDGTLKKTIRKGLKVMCREIQTGVAAAQLALADGGLAPGSYDCDRTGVVYGSDYIMTAPEEFAAGIRACLNDEGKFDFRVWAEQGLPKVTPLWLLKYLPNMPASHIAIYNDLRGPNNSLTLREASSNLALGEATMTILRCGADRMLAGARGTRLHPLRTVHVVLQEELSTGGEPSELCAPFDQNRRGSVLGEGAATLVLEEIETAQARGAKIYAEVIGYGSSTVRDRDGVPDCGQALENVLLQSLRSAGIGIDDVGHIHAHGIATRQGDKDEAQAIERVFRKRRTPVPVVAAKSYFGNLGAASGMVETIASILALRNQRLFPILNYKTPDPDCPIFAATADSPAGSTFININVSPVGQASAIVIRAAG